MKTANLIKGLELLRPFYDNMDASFISSDQDVIHAQPTKKRLPRKIIKKLIALEWFQGNDAKFLDYYEKKDMSTMFSVDDYNPDAIWTAYL